MLDQSRLRELAASIELEHRLARVGFELLRLGEPLGVVLHHDLGRRKIELLLAIRHLEALSLDRDEDDVQLALHVHVGGSQQLDRTPVRLPQVGGHRDGKRDRLSHVLRDVLHSVEREPVEEWVVAERRQRVVPREHHVLCVRDLVAQEDIERLRVPIPLERHTDWRRLGCLAHLTVLCLRQLDPNGLHIYDLLAGQPLQVRRRTLDQLLEASVRVLALPCHRNLRERRGHLWHKRRPGRVEGILRKGLVALLAPLGARHRNHDARSAFCDCKLEELHRSLVKEEVVREQEDADVCSAQRPLRLLLILRLGHHPHRVLAQRRRQHLAEGNCRGARLRSLDIGYYRRMGG
mmetsp:Transcript_62583/g.166276  ORF Transcript_62583/g.166276 Transcript_62583/m.166276 type:complete len:349 (-) Transcript_62583:337-1383(-)